MVAAYYQFTPVTYRNGMENDTTAWIASTAYRLLPSILLSTLYIIAFALLIAAFYVRKYAQTARRRENGNDALFCLYFIIQLTVPVFLGFAVIYAYNTDFSDNFLPQFQLPLVVAAMGFLFSFFETKIPKALDYEVAERNLSLKKCARIKQVISLLTIAFLLTFLKTGLYLIDPVFFKTLITLCAAAQTAGNSLICWKMLQDGTIAVPNLPQLASLLGLPTYAMAMESKIQEIEAQPPAYSSLPLTDVEA